MVPGITIFLLLPSVLFYYVETDWTYLDSVYYAFISLATIGFGDLVNGEFVKSINSFGVKWYSFLHLCCDMKDMDGMHRSR